MKSKDWELWLFFGLLAVLAYAAGSQVEDSSGIDSSQVPAGGGSTVDVSKLANQIRASGLDTSKYDDIVNSASMTFSVPVQWIKAVIGQESTFRENPPVRLGDQSYGLMQLTPKTAKGLGFTGNIPADLIVPSTNIYLGTMLLGQLRQAHGDDFSAVYSAYNSGSATAYLSNAQVAQDVADASAWLDYFTSVSA